MYKLEVDKNKKLVKVTVSGFVKIDEVNSIFSELQNAMKQFKPKEALFLVDASEFKPASPDVLPVMQKIQSTAADYFKKFASIHSNIISQMQVKRVSVETNIEDHIARFKTEQEALKYLFE